jgi:hypothetical protein
MEDYKYKSVKTACETVIIHNRARELLQKCKDDHDASPEMIRFAKQMLKITATAAKIGIELAVAHNSNK